MNFLLPKMNVIDKVEDKWQVDLNRDLTDRDWCYISSCIQKITVNVAHRASLYVTA